MNDVTPHLHDGHEHHHDHGAVHDRPRGDGGADGTVYTCPMHPQVRQPQPGNCPICGMTLEPVLPSLDDEESPELARREIRHLHD